MSYNKEKGMNRFPAWKPAAAWIFILGAVLVPSVASAGWLFDLDDLAYSVVSKVFFGISWIVAWIASLVIAVEAWVLEIVLDINTRIVESAPVRYGFPVALSLANLGFVLGIIVIAVMTIIRQQSYGIKQALWKLVLMAVLVNFGLVIAAGILQFFDQLTFYFLRGISPGTCLADTPECRQTNFQNFASAIAGAFNPQAGMVGFNDVAEGGPDSQKVAAWGTTLGKMLVPLASLLGVAFMLIMIIITLAALIVMLVIRYVYLGYLLVLLPLAWASWVFPLTQKHWHKWWDTFLKQAFFPVMVMFFLWLVILTSREMSLGIGSVTAGSTASSGMTAIVAVLGNIFSPLVQIGLQQAIMVGLAMGGLFAAQSISIKFADTAMKGANATVKGFGTWAGNVSKRGASYPLRSETGRRVTQALQTAGTNAPRPLRWAARPIRELGQKLSQAKQPVESMVRDAERQLNNLSVEERARRFGSANSPERLAILLNLQRMAQQRDDQQNPTAAANAALAALRNIGHGLGGATDEQAAEARQQTVERLMMLYGRGAVGETNARLQARGVNLQETVPERGRAEELIEQIRREEQERIREQQAQQPPPPPPPAGGGGGGAPGGGGQPNP